MHLPALLCLTCSLLTACGDKPPVEPQESGDSSGETGEPPQPDSWTSPPLPEPGTTITVHYKGRLSDREAVTLMYGFDGWNAVASDPTLTRTGTSSNYYYHHEVAMTRVEGGFEASIPIPSGTRTLHWKFWSDEDILRIWDDDDRTEWHRAMEVFPFAGPWLTWSESTPSGGVVVSFETDLDGPAAVEWGVGDLTEEAMDAGGDTLHHILLAPLSPDTPYSYRVRDQEGRVSDTYTFRTLPSDPTSLRFAALSDIQDNGDDMVWSTVAGALLEQDPELLVLAGDLTMDDDPGTWWIFFDKGRELLASRVMVPAPGNHDTPDKGKGTSTLDFERWFPMPWDSAVGTVYRMDLGLATFLALNSNEETEFTAGTAQYTWMEQQLAALGCGEERTVPWVFAFWHYPAYNAGDRHERDVRYFQPVTATFQGCVDWVVNGHEHLYQRFLPLQYPSTVAPSGEWGHGSDDGVGYIVLPPGGNDVGTKVVATTSVYAAARDLLAWPTLTADQTVVPSEDGFVILEITADTFYLESWGVGTNVAPQDPHIVDTLTLTR